MADTTIKVDSTVRDRLAVLAREQGTTIRDLVRDLAGARPTREECEVMAAADLAYIREHLCPDLTDEDLEAGELFWKELEAGRIPESMDMRPVRQDRAA